MVMLSAAGSKAEVLQELRWWEQRVKPGGILAGRDFGPASAEGVQAVCSWRHFNDLHLGIGGTFWWYVEPEE